MPDRVSVFSGKKTTLGRKEKEFFVFERAVAVDPETSNFVWKRLCRISAKKLARSDFTSIEQLLASANSSSTNPWRKWLPNAMKRSQHLKLA